MKYTKEILEDAIVDCFSYADVLRKFGVTIHGGTTCAYCGAKEK